MGHICKKKLKREGGERGIEKKEKRGERERNRNLQQD
jgi:hypothetical protein